jgi:hypothetical protein
MPPRRTPLRRSELRRKPGAPFSAKVPPRTRSEREFYIAERAAAFAACDGRCMADGLHHPDCPGRATVPHHIRPRRDGGSDSRDNLLPVWGGFTRLGGCHDVIHNQFPAMARQLGYLD